MEKNSAHVVQKGSFVTEVILGCSRLLAGLRTFLKI